MIPAKSWPEGLAPGTTLHRARVDGEERGCILSPCELYRYALWAVWDQFVPILMMCGLNPSEATHEVDDPTWKRQRERARRLHMGGCLMMNAAAIRETNRAKAMAHPEAIGRDNEIWLRTLAPLCDLHIVGYGADAKRCGGDRLVQRVFQEIGLPAYCLRVLDDGSPGHPLYIGYDTTPILYDWRD